MNISYIEDILENMFLVAEDTDDSIVVELSRPDIAGIANYKVKYADGTFEGNVWRGLSDDIYMGGTLI